MTPPAQNPSNESNEREIPTFCRVCEPACGLIAHVKDGELVRLRPDKDNPVTRGFACNKGLAGDEIHRDPDRVDHPLRRCADGGFERISWDEAINEIASKLKTIQGEHGPNSFAPYIGNPTAFNTLAAPAMGALFAQLGTRRSFSSGTQDCANKFAGSEAVFGSSTMHPVPDLAHTDFFLSFGANPRVSHASFISIPDPVRVIKAVVARGGRVVHVNPRRIESEKTRAGETLLIRPDTDVYLLAALIHEIDREGGFDEEIVREHGKHVTELREFVAQYSANRVAMATGISAEEIRNLARDFAGASSASVHMSTGVNMGRQGTLAYWLLHMLSFVTGNLDRRGGNILSVGFYESAKAGRRSFADSFVDSEYGRLRKGSLPGNLLPDYVLQEQDPVRAMITVAGNPVLSIGGEDRLRAAMEKLELLVVIDLYRNATAEYADYILPATDGFERSDINITGLGLQHEPWIQFTDKVVEARGERREEWWILGKLAQEMGLKSPFDENGEAQGLWGRIDHMLHARGLTLDDVRKHPHGLAFEGLTAGRFYSDHLQTDDGLEDDHASRSLHAQQLVREPRANEGWDQGSQLSLCPSGRRGTEGRRQGRQGSALERVGRDPRRATTGRRSETWRRGVDPRLGKRKDARHACRPQYPGCQPERALALGRWKLRPAFESSLHDGRSRRSCAGLSRALRLRPSRTRRASPS